MKISTVIVDDEPLARKGLSLRLAEFENIDIQGKGEPLKCWLIMGAFAFLRYLQGGHSRFSDICVLATFAF